MLRKKSTIATLATTGLKVARAHVSLRELMYYLSIVMQPMLEIDLPPGRGTFLPHTDNNTD
jgi:hypothetical protein